MTAAQYTALEDLLTAAEELFVGVFLLGARTQKIRDELKALVVKVTAERIRAEKREGKNVRGDLE